MKSDFRHRAGCTGPSGCSCLGLHQQIQSAAVQDMALHRYSCSSFKVRGTACSCDPFDAPDTERFVLTSTPRAPVAASKPKPTAHADKRTTLPRAAVEQLRRNVAAAEAVRVDRERVALTKSLETVAKRTGRSAADLQKFYDAEVKAGRMQPLKAPTGALATDELTAEEEAYCRKRKCDPKAFLDAKKQFRKQFE